MAATGVGCQVCCRDTESGRRDIALWVASAAAPYLVVLIITFTVNIPLNNGLAAGCDVAKLTDFSIVGESKGAWVTTYIIRSLLCTAALSRALILYGRAITTR
ncbi:DUF1772 domain-containing protein [Streptomyces sp. NPDC102278]|uniref:DUF1772 domain-containing protein n=1 Tax=Streptomyces sp. NPDC102278 TaxID=3366152 RepID=UPI003801FA99